jgi:hypothetical protein
MTVTWTNEPFALDATAIAAAYAALRPALARDPLFIADAEDYGVSLDVLDARMRSPPTTLADGGELYTWLDGADQYRYAGLHVLLRAYGAAKTLELEGPVVVPDGAMRIVRGDVAIDGTLELGTQAMVVILGALRVAGAIVTRDYDYSMVAARSIECREGCSSGELIATERIVARGAFYFAGNDYSARAPRYEGELLVDFERGNAFTEVAVARRLTQWSFDAAADALGVARGVDLAPAVRAKLTASGR